MEEEEKIRLKVVFRDIPSHGRVRVHAEVLEKLEIEKGSTVLISPVEDDPTTPEDERELHLNADIYGDDLVEDKDSIRMDEGDASKIRIVQGEYVFIERKKTLGEKLHIRKKKTEEE